MAYFVRIKARWVHELVESLERDYPGPWPDVSLRIPWSDDVLAQPRLTLRPVLNPIDVVAAALISEMQIDLFVEAVT